MASIEAAIEITIDADGRVVTHVNGAEGPSCLADIQAFEDLLGTATVTTKKPQYYRGAVRRVSHVHGRSASGDG